MICLLLGMFYRVYLVGDVSSRIRHYQEVFMRLDCRKISMLNYWQIATLIIYYVSVVRQELLGYCLHRHAGFGHQIVRV